MNSSNQTIDPFEAHRRHMAELRDKYAAGRATEQEIQEFWEEALKDPEQLQLLKTEVNLRAVMKKNAN